MDKSGNKPDKVSYRIERATITRADPGKHDKPYQVEVWRVISIEEHYFHFNTKEDADDFVRIIFKGEEKCMN